ncbi:tetratricopeptide repeat protein [Sphaerospermopsis sp. FACHB-1094]|uniref:tetratricopeptide repeat protein n=1 Tax=Sphaerospermopsis sp. FACHB-1094 TaxID=2692861 RepID=UPI001688FFBF|nr:tetratricopeptide repeat protein [Sphaerospermopsis sp. FACHB-1094]MBD2134058.1 tetratricopeptide repeat protein [Sphaerospermopsis sp. FACHB-1094]
MTISEKEYFAKRSKQIEKRKRILTIVSIVLFFGSIAFGGISTLLSSLSSAKQQPQQSATESVTTQLQKQAQGYESVLQREPNNQVALEKLSIIRVKLGEYERAIALIERLVQLYPDRQDYKTVLAEVKKKNTGK